MNCVVLNQRHSVSFYVRMEQKTKKNQWNSEFVLRHSLLSREQRFDFVGFFCTGLLTDSVYATNKAASSSKHSQVERLTHADGSSETRTSAFRGDWRQSLLTSAWTFNRGVYIYFIFFPFQKERGHSSSEWINEAAALQNKVNRPGSALRQFINITPRASYFKSSFFRGEMKIPERSFQLKSR